MQSNRFWLDISLVAASLAIDRGVLPSVQQTLESVKFRIPKTPALENQALFLYTTSKGDLTTLGMRSQALNRKLQDMSEMVGIYERNTMYF